MAVYQLASSGAKPPLPKRDAELVELVQGELTEFYEEMQRFDEMEPDEVMAKLSSFAARAGELRLRLVRSTTNRLQALRTKEVEPFLDACEFQFKVASRIQAIREMDWKLVRGQT